MKTIINCVGAICWAIVLFLEIATLSKTENKQIPNSVALIATLVCLLSAVASIVSSCVQG